MLNNGSAAQFTNVNLNSVGSGYAATYGHNVSNLVQKLTNKMIFDAQPQQFLDLKLLNLNGVEGSNSDEFFFQEMGYQREALVTTASASAVTYPTTQNLDITTTDFAANDMIVVYPNGVKGNIVSVDTSLNRITVRPMVGEGLPAVTSGDLLGYVSSVYEDGAEGFSQNFRATTIERSNFIQLYSMAIKYGEVELHKLRNQGTTSNFLSMENEAMFMQHRIGLSNSMWIGKKGEVQLANGKFAKTTGGVYSSMQEAGSPYTTATASTFVDAFEDMVMSSEYGKYGKVRFAYMLPRVHRALSKAYKEESTLYAPNDEIALLNLQKINIGSSVIVPVPFARFGDNASFPQSFENKVIILDHENIKRRQMWGERSGNTLSLKDGIPKRTAEVYVDSNMGIEFNNPLACAHMDVTL